MRRAMLTEWWPGKGTWTWRQFNTSGDVTSHGIAEEEVEECLPKWTSRNSTHESDISPQTYSLESHSPRFLFLFVAAAPAAGYTTRRLFNKYVNQFIDPLGRHQQLLSMTEEAADGKICILVATWNIANCDNYGPSGRSL